MLRKPFDFEIKAAESGTMEFAGYAAVFGNIDRTGDIIVPRAFADSLPQFLREGVIAYQHRWDCPIGKPLECREDEHGLFLRARLVDTEQGLECHKLLREGIITKLSIGYDIVDSEWLTPDNIETFLRDGHTPPPAAIARALATGRALQKLTLYEVSPVSIPANPACEIVSATLAGERGSAAHAGEQGSASHAGEPAAQGGRGAGGQGAAPALAARARAEAVIARANGVAV